MRHKHRIMLGFIFAAISLSAHAGEGLERLKKFTAELQSLQADFVQTVFDEQMQPLEIAHGAFTLQKPSRFRWDYTAPYQQHIIADGQKLWLYDPELEQVTVQPLAEALGAAPIALLTGTDIQQQFTVVELGNIEGREFLQLEVKVKDTDYDYLLLALNETGLDVMELKDKLGQVTRIEFNNVRLNADVNPDLFAFTVPPGVDVVGLLEDHSTLSPKP